MSAAVQSRCRIPIVAFALALLGAAAAAQSGSTWRLSVNSQGEQGSLASSLADVSADGRWVVFDSSADNMVPGDTNWTEDVFLLDRVKGTIELVSATPAGVPGNALSGGCRISADGLWVAFTSSATDLVAGDTNGAADVFLRDLTTGQTRRVSFGPGGLQADGPSWNGAISDDGQLVAFESYATNLVPGDTNAVGDVFVYDRAADKVLRVSVDPWGAQADGRSQQPSISGDGRVVAFSSLATNLHKGDLNGTWDIYLHELASGSTVIASLTSSGQVPSYSSNWPDLSGDGTYVAFQSLSALLPADTNGTADIYVRNMNGGQLTLVTVDTGGGPTNGPSMRPTICAAGDVVAFDSDATDLVAGDTNLRRDVFVRDLGLATTQRVSVSTSLQQADFESEYGVVSPAGDQVLFFSTATNLVPHDTNWVDDTFVRELGGCSPTVVTYCTASIPSVFACQVTLQGLGLPTFSDPTAFQVRTVKMLGGVPGIAYLGVYGPAASPFGTQGGFFCVQSPFWRAPLKTSGGTKGQCNGQMSYTLAELITASHGAITAGETVHVALWFRDNANPDGFALSSGVWFHVCP